MIGLLLGRLELSRESGEALTRQLTNQLRALITGGCLRPGQNLPSSRTLARSLNVSRNTVSFAIEQLTAEGYLSTSQGRRPLVVAGTSLLSSRAPSRRAENRGMQGLVFAMGSRASSDRLAANLPRASARLSARIG